MFVRPSLCFILVFGLLGGCAHAPRRVVRDEEPIVLLERVCRVGPQTGEVSGSVWIQAQSVEASGRFPAEVVARAGQQANQRSLDIEILNPLGGTEARLQVRGDRYELIRAHDQSNAKNPRDSASGKDDWSGIPLQWAYDLFMGRIPCPHDNLKKVSQMSATDDSLIVEGTVGATREKFIYRMQWFESGEGAGYWPIALTWERTPLDQKDSSPLSVDFQFERPFEDATRSPQVWRAKTQKGEVHVRWRERNVRS